MTLIESLKANIKANTKTIEYQGETYYLVKSEMSPLILGTAINLAKGVAGDELKGREIDTITKAVIDSIPLGEDASAANWLEYLELPYDAWGAKTGVEVLKNLRSLKALDVLRDSEMKPLYSTQGEQMQLVEMMNDEQSVAKSESLAAIVEAAMNEDEVGNDADKAASNIGALSQENPVTQ